MKKTILSCIALTCIFTATKVFAVENQGAYINGNIGLVLHDDSSYTTTAAGSGEISFDPGVTFMGGGGYDFGMWRVEGEFSFTVADVDDYTEGGNTYSGGDRGLDVWSLMVNGIFEIENKSKMTPFFLLGLGYSYIDGFNVDTGTGTAIADSDTLWGWQLGLGVDYYFTNTLSMAFAYRYLVTDDISFRTGEMEYGGHRLLLGIKKIF